VEKVPFSAVSEFRETPTEISLVATGTEDS
jgi:hypothetical protein